MIKMSNTNIIKEFYLKNEYYIFSFIISFILSIIISFIIKSENCSWEGKQTIFQNIASLIIVMIISLIIFWIFKQYFYNLIKKILIVVIILLILSFSFFIHATCDYFRSGVIISNEFTLNRESNILLIDSDSKFNTAYAMIYIKDLCPAEYDICDNGAQISQISIKDCGDLYLVQNTKNTYVFLTEEETCYLNGNWFVGYNDLFKSSIKIVYNYNGHTYTHYGTFGSFVEHNKHFNLEEFKYELEKIKEPEQELAVNSPFIDCSNKVGTKLRDCNEINEGIISGNPDYCYTVTDTNQDRCFFEVGKVLNDSSVCNNIISTQIPCYDCPTLKDECFDFFGKNELKEEYCNQINNNNTKNNCYIYIAIEKQNVSLCEFVLEKYKGIRECENQVAVATQELNICNQLTYILERELCYKQLGIATMNLSVCNLIVDTDQYKKECYYGVAKNNQDTNICYQYSKFLDIEYCLTEIAKITHNSTLCKDIKTVWLKEDCEDVTW
jgi:hypothetical protein